MNSNLHRFLFALFVMLETGAALAQTAAVSRRTLYLIGDSTVPTIRAVCKAGATRSRCISIRKRFGLRIAPSVGAAAGLFTPKDFGKESAPNSSLGFRDHATRDWVEGPSAIQIGEEFLVYFDGYTTHRYEAMRSRDLRNWEDVSSRIVFPKGTRHGTALPVEPELLEALLRRHREQTTAN